jgi:hypothetical protein
MTEDRKLHLVVVPDAAEIGPEPWLPPDLVRLMAATHATRLPGIEPDDPGMVTAGRSPEWHPLAAQFADQFRSLLDPAPRDLIQQWLATFGVGLAVTARTASGDLILGWQNAVCSACGSLARAVWCQETLGEAWRAYDWWPSPAKLYALLEPHDRRLRRKLADLDASAAAPRDRAPQGPAKESTVPYEPVASAEAPARHFNPRSVVQRALNPVRTREEQLAALGLPPDWKPPAA